MVDVNIDDLVAATLPLAGTELMEVQQGGVNRQTTTGDLADLASGVFGSFVNVNQLVGSSPPSTGLKMVAGTTVVTLSSNEATITFPSAFTGVITVIAMNGDTNAQTAGVAGTESVTTTNFVVRANAVSGGYRVNWIAIGW